MNAPAVRLTRSDAQVLAAVMEHSQAGNTQKLSEFVHDYDWLNRALPTFEEVSFALHRLVATGHVVVSRQPGKRIRLRATPKAIALRRQVEAKARTLGDVVAGVALALGCASYPEPESEDQSLGPLPTFQRAEWEGAVEAYEKWFDHWTKPWLTLSRFVHWWFRHTRPEDYR